MDIRKFQSSLAASPTSLHTITVVTVIVWMIVGGSAGKDFSQYGVWNLLPEYVCGAGWINTALVILTVAITIYVIGELNISQVMLRLNSRAMSFTFAALITASTFLHSFTPGYVVMFFLLLSYFTLFSSYQQESTAGLAYVTFLYIGISALVFPKVIWLAPIYWLSMYILRAINARSISGSILGLVTPFWITGSIAFCCDKMNNFVGILKQMVDFHLGGYSSMSTGEILMSCLLFIIFIIGVLDFYMRIYLDKTRTRIIYNIIILHGCVYFILLLLQPVCSAIILPMVIMNTSIIGGHYIANDSTSLSNTVVCMLSLFVIIAFVLNVWIL